ncbi:DsrE family protein [Enterococcus mediterraneensis]|uniref:DsrE family protein n=1 Tax=Enterococcus mediterraneensis TaxID=2364791 RepID=UPI000F0520D1|nr:DsrE family protein [Enterococcus mediterraneensis]
MKAVFHIDEMAKWPQVKQNILNLIAGNYNTTIVLTINGAAIKGLLEQENQEFFENPEVIFHACNNSLRGNDIDPSLLPKTVKIVPTGVYDLIQLQHNGYAYIKP